VPAPAPALALAPPKLDLATCRAIALEKQPAVSAARASLAVAIARQQAVERLGGLALLQRDLKTRKEQAARGVIAAQAAAQLAEMDTIYAVQFTYLSYLYARTQEQVARDAVAQLEDFKERTKLPVEAKLLDKERDIARIDAFLQLVKAREQEAITGARRALSGLREALGVDAPCLKDLAHDRLFKAPASVSCDEMVALALARRPEIVQASIGLEVTDLEVAAQHSRPLALTLRTFAMASDIHANPLPATRIDGEYRPGAIGPEMPVTINGYRADRVEQASIYSGRAHDLLNKTKGLIRLQVEQIFLRFQEANNRMTHLAAAAEHARIAWRKMRNEFRKDPNDLKLTQVLMTAQMATELRVQMNEAHYQVLLGLAGLERATAGGFSAGLEKVPVDGKD
jgi:outer membrane protein TolC